MKAVLQNLSPENADIFALVLASEGIHYRFEHHLDGIDLLIEDDDFEKACHIIGLYLEENIPSPDHANPFIERFNKTYSGLFIAALLFFIHTSLISDTYRQGIIDHYGASAEHILHGDIYRCVTALFLHADDAHLAGNMAGIVVFGTSVISISGSGIGWFMILMSGVIGNGLNAIFFQNQHLSIGASTAVFGAIGILAGYRSTRLFTEYGLHFKSFLPIGAGLALLGILGTSAHADLTAHLFGFMSGLCSGMILTRITPQTIPDWVQAVFLFISSLILAFAWSR